VYGISVIRRAAVPSALGQGGALGELLAGLFVMVVLLFLLIVRANLFDPLLSLINEQIFNKSLSSSFQERSFWNTTAWNTIDSTWGLGVGFGSTRASNWFAAIASNTGVVGATCMAIFLIQTFLRRPIWRTAWSAELLIALKMSMLPVFIMAGVVSAGPDFGPWAAVVLGAITGIAAIRPKRGAVGMNMQDTSMQKPASRRTTIRGRVPATTVAWRRLRDDGHDRPAPSP
jgi:hypothetical protein